VFLHLPQGRLEARRIDGPEPTVVFLHEGLGSAGLWRNFPDQVCAATGHGGLIYSRFGYGDSDPAPLPRPVTYLDDEGGLLPAVLAAAGVSAAILLGHSDGGSIALAAAAADGRAVATGQERRILGAALLAPHVTVEDDNLATIRDAGERYANTDLRERLARHHHNVDVAFRGWHDAWIDPAFKAWSLTGKLPDVTVPVLVVQGEADPYGSTDQARLIAAGVSGPVDMLLLPDCGHSPQRDQPVETLTAVVRLVERSAQQAQA
jgi:pimeloyl-ACP methyl ester carboxylesterase